MFQLTPHLIDLALERLGLAASQLKSLDTECKRSLIGFMIKAVQSGNANAYIKERLAWLDEYEERKAEPPPAVRVTSRAVREEQESGTMGPRPRPKR